jgi:DNA replication protein DnaC
VDSTPGADWASEGFTHLPTVRECYEETARRAERETLSYEQYLLEVISRECEQRRKLKVQRLLKDSALPLEKSLPNFDLKRLPAKAARQLRTLLGGGFLDRKENVLVFGNPGSGKSHLLTALAQELVVARERKLRFTKCASADAGSAGGQAGPAAEPGDQTAGPL